MDFTPLPKAAAQLESALRSVVVDGLTNYISGLQVVKELLGSDDFGDEYTDVGFLTRIVFLSDGGHNLDRLREEIFRTLEIIRVYSKAPGKGTSKEAPYTLKAGSTLLDFAAAVHKDFSEKLKHARVWGSSAFDGQTVSSDYVLADGDIVELRI